VIEYLHNERRIEMVNVDPETAMIDMHEADHVEIKVALGVLWVNVNERCRLRIGKVPRVTVEHDTGVILLSESHREEKH
jgi:hypothetical protein